MLPFNRHFECTKDSCARGWSCDLAYVSATLLYELAVRLLKSEVVKLAVSLLAAALVMQYSSEHRSFSGFLNESKRKFSNKRSSQRQDGFRINPLYIGYQWIEYK